MVFFSFSHSNFSFSSFFSELFNFSLSRLMSRIVCFKFSIRSVLCFSDSVNFSCNYSEYSFICCSTYHINLLCYKGSYPDMDSDLLFVFLEHFFKILISLIFYYTRTIKMGLIKKMLLKFLPV